LIDPLLGLYFILFVVLLLVGVPIAFSMTAASLLYAVINNQSFVMFAQKTANALSDFNMLAIPAFLFVGIFMNEIGLTDRIFTMAEKWIGHFTGGLAHANVLASMIFAGMSGSALADAGGLGTIEVKAMKDAGYDVNFAVAVTAASASIGPIIPPSINFVIWAFLSQCSTLAMFMGGLIPGMVMGLSMMVWIVIAVKKFKIKAPTCPKASWRDRFYYTWKALPALGGPAILILGIFSGIFTPTECGVVAAAYCVAVSIGYRKFSFAMLLRALKNTLSSAAMVMALAATGLIFNWMIVTSGLINIMAGVLLAIKNPYVVLFILNVAMLIMGCFIGSMQILIMIAPLLMSIADGLGLNYVHMGVLAVLNVTLGIITPPMAPALFVTCKATGNSFDRALKYTVQFLIPLVITLLLVSFIPDFVLWLPRFMGVLR
jgi:tripartite ATP-independent transporter DctM subunit